MRTTVRLRLFFETYVPCYPLSEGIGQMDDPTLEAMRWFSETLCNLAIDDTWRLNDSILNEWINREEYRRQAEHEERWYEERLFEEEQMRKNNGSSWYLIS